MINIYRELTLAIVESHCPDVPAEALYELYVKMMDVPFNGDPKSLAYAQLQYFIGFVLAYVDEPVRSLEAFEASLASRPGASSAMAMAALLATNEHYPEALRLADLALQQLESRGASALRGPMVSEDDIRAFQAVVRADLAAQRGDGTPDPAE
jgi:hypothetical protein